MRIRPGRTSLFALAALCSAAYVILFVVAPGSGAQKASCGPAGAHTVVADGTARIYRVPTGHTSLRPFYSYFGCIPGQAKPQLLASTNPLSEVRAIRLRGAKAGFIVDEHGVDTGSSTLTVRDLADGRVLHTVAVSYQVPRLFNSLITYVLAPSGNVAWVTESSPNLGPHGEVAISRAIGHTVTTLDQGRAISASSLRLRGHMLDWVDGGKHRHARLP